MTSTIRAGVVLVAAGSGTRAGSGVPKQWRTLRGVPVLRRALQSLRADPRIGPIVVAIRPEDSERFEAAAAGLSARAVSGGAERADSVRAGLAALPVADLDSVLVHDAARPVIPTAVLDRLFEALDRHEGAVPALAVADALKRGADGLIEADVPRAGLYGVQTPQAFRAEALIAAYAALPPGSAPLDDAAVVTANGGRVALVAGHPSLMKLTTADDFATLEALMGIETRLPRTGLGVDAHRFAPGDHVTLCGLRIPYSMGLAAHSDGDVGWHTIADALYGALAEGDIGQHFPPSDPQWKGAPSETFLAHAAERVRARGGRILNVDLTLICEAPKIGPHRDAMRANTARVLGIPIAAVAVKATTTEKMGFTGRGEGIAGQAVATILLPDPDLESADVAR